MGHAIILSDVDREDPLRSPQEMLLETKGETE